MHLRAWIAVAAVGVAAYLARRHGSPEPDEPARLVAPDKPVVGMPPPTLEPARDSDDEAESEDEPQLAEPEDADDEAPVVVIEKPLPAARGNTIHGRMRDADSGELLAGVTIVASSLALEHVQTAITDENGYYLIGELPTGEYTVTIYYLQGTLEHAHVWVTAVAAAVVDDDIDSNYRVEPIEVTITGY